MAEGRTFLLEIGCEEIPAPMIPKALDDLTAGLLAALGPLVPVVRALAAAASPSRDLGGPRRLVALITALEDREVDREERVTGPPKSAAFDAQGQPTRAALGFAKGQGVEVADLQIVSTPKGEVVSATKKIKGRSTAEVLAVSVPSVLGAMRFGKMMRWGDGGHVFVRPVKWILALLDAEVVPFEFVGVSSGRTTRGHRFLGPGPHQVASASDYESVLREKGRLIVRIEERRRTLLDLATREAASAGGRLRPDPDLLEELTFLTEHPAVVRGSFPAVFLELPEPVLLTTMRHHQKYLTVEGTDGRLKNAFIAVLTTDNDARGLIRMGNEWVLRARLADARFFFDEDRKVRLEDRIPDLSRVTFHAKLGTYADKCERMRRLIARVQAGFGKAGTHSEDESRDLMDALQLCKTDLTTAMVGEFPELQGTIGGIYARLEGRTEGCARAIEEHYLPTSTTGPVPSRGVPSILALTDKLDTLARCFAASLVPKGSSDPFGLRRAALGILRILIENEIRLDLAPLLKEALDEVAGSAAVHTSHAGTALEEFLRQRLQFLMEESGIRFDAARAVLAIGWSDPLVAFRRAKALHELRGKDDFLALAAAAKRVRNILAQAEQKGIEGAAIPLDPSRLEAGPEAELHRAMDRAKGEAVKHSQSEDYRGALSSVASLRPAVDRFFDKVLVMDPDQRTRANRLALLADLSRLLSREADFAEIVVEGETQAETASSRGTGG